tara:strand:- start:189 stop:1091 length:903 start_codon:yes stop_codon:yes gene_type:complete
MTNKNSPKIAKIFSCQQCDYNCFKQSDYNKHLLTLKHRIRTNTNEKPPKVAKSHLCSCGKRYKHASSLWNHKKKCDYKEENLDDKKQNFVEETQIINENIDYKSLLIKAMDQLSEQQKTMNEMIDKVGTTNNTMNTTNNFNINMFLNEKCKDAINLSDFIERIEVSHDDLENNAQLGFVNGITKILMDNLNQLTLYQRPIHCTDTKRETLYIKDQDKWEKDLSDKKLEGAIQEVSRKSIGSLLQWKKENPDYENIDSEFSNKCIYMQQHSLAGVKSDVLYPKIIHNLAKENVINKSTAMK